MRKYQVGQVGHVHFFGIEKMGNLPYNLSTVLVSFERESRFFLNEGFQEEKWLRTFELSYRSILTTKASTPFKSSKVNTRN